MNPWSQDNMNGMFPQATQGHLNSMYAGGIANPTPQFDASHFQSPIPNGAPFQNQPFAGSVVPAKRPHDGMGGSPPPPPPSASRSQTPGFQQFSTPQPGQQYPAAPNPFAHLQQPSSNQATPSPTMQNQQYRPPQPQPQQQPRMNNASPSPFPNQQNQFANQMPHQQQPHNQQPGIPQQPMGINPAFAPQQYGMQNMSMPGMPSAMSAQANAMAGMSNDAQQYRMKLMQQQRQMQQANGMMPGRPPGAPQNQMYNQPARQQMPPQMPTGQHGQLPSQPNANQNQKRMAFMQALRQLVHQSGQPANLQPTIAGRPVDLFALWSITTQLGGAGKVDMLNQWPNVAAKLGYPPQRIPTAPEEMKQIHATSGVVLYEKMWFARQMHVKQEQARIHAQQMAGIGAAQNAGSPVKMMQTPTQQISQPPQFNHVPQAQTPQNPQATPVQANAPLPQNGVSTPVQMMGTPLQQHRRNSSLRKPDMTPQPPAQAVTAPSPKSLPKPQPLPSTQPPTTGRAMKLEEVTSSNYEPQIRFVTTDGGVESGIQTSGGALYQIRPSMPLVDDMGVIDTRAITLSLASGIHSEVRYALDALAVISSEKRISFDLEKCDDLIDVLVDCAEDQTDALSEDAAEVSDEIDLPSYEDIHRSSRVEVETLQEVHEFGSHESDLDLAADRLIAVTTILRNFSFFEHNHRLLTSTSLIKWVSNTIRLLGTRNMLLRTWLNTLDFFKDIVTFLSNVTQSLELSSRDDALHILHFLLAFAPQPSPTYEPQNGGRIRFTNFNPRIHRYLPPAIDCLAKLLARTEPNRGYYRSIFAATAPSSPTASSKEPPFGLLTSSFALAVSVLPDRIGRGNLKNALQERIVDARKAYLTQGMLAADILVTLLPPDSAEAAETARTWLQSADGWAMNLLNMAGLLSVEKPNSTPIIRPGMGGQMGRELGLDTDSPKLITRRALMMLKRVVERARGSKGRSIVLGGGLSESASPPLVNGTASLQGKKPLSKDAKTNGEAINGQDTEQDERTSKRRKSSPLNPSSVVEIPLPTRDGIPQRHALQGALLLPTADNDCLSLLSELFESNFSRSAGSLYDDDDAASENAFTSWWNDHQDGEQDE